MSLLPDWTAIQPAAPVRERQALALQARSLRREALAFCRLAPTVALSNLRRAAHHLLKETAMNVEIIACRCGRPMPSSALRCEICEAARVESIRRVHNRPRPTRKVGEGAITYRPVEPQLLRSLNREARPAPRSSTRRCLYLPCRRRALHRRLGAFCSERCRTRFLTLLVLLLSLSIATTALYLAHGDLR